MLEQVISRLGEIVDFRIWSEWFAQLDRPFIFLLSLPFVVAVVGLWAACRDKEQDRE